MYSPVSRATSRYSPGSAFLHMHVCLENRFCYCAFWRKHCTGANVFCVVACHFDVARGGIAPAGLSQKYTCILRGHILRLCTFNNMFYVGEYILCCRCASSAHCSAAPVVYVSMGFREENLRARTHSILDVLTRLARHIAVKVQCLTVICASEHIL